LSFQKNLNRITNLVEAKLNRGSHLSVSAYRDNNVRFVLESHKIYFVTRSAPRPCYCTMSLLSACSFQKSKSSRT